MDSETRATHEKQNTQIAVIMSEIGHIRELIEEIKKQLDAGKSQFAPLDRFNRLEGVVYGGLGLIISGVIISGLALLIK